MPTQKTKDLGWSTLQRKAELKCHWLAWVQLDDFANRQNSRKILMRSALSTSPTPIPCKTSQTHTLEEKNFEIYGTDDE